MEKYCFFFFTLLILCYVKDQMKKIFAPSQDIIPINHREHTENCFKIGIIAQKNMKYGAKRNII